MSNLDYRLQKFAKDNGMSGKGALCVALVVTRQAKKLGLPLTQKDFMTTGGGQVKGLGKAAVQKILKDHGISRVLAEEGGRTSRGSVGNMKSYVEFLNDLNEEETLGVEQLDNIEEWWMKMVLAFFAGKPFSLRLDSSKSLRFVVKDLLEQAEKRQLQAPGSTYVGTMLQHLIGAKLNLLVKGEVQHHGASVADEVSRREGDFTIDDVAIHVTASPGEALIRKCIRNLENGIKPMIITAPNRSLIMAEGLASQEGVSDRVDIFEAEQFIAGNLYEIGKFAQKGRQTTTRQLIEEYNSIVEECETDPSLKIKLLK